MGKPILCLDFDGVLHSYSSGWKGAAVIPDPPVPGALEFLANATDSFTVAILSSRSHQWGGRRAMKRWLYKHLYELGKDYEAAPEWWKNRVMVNSFADPWPEDVSWTAKRLIRSIKWPIFKPPAMVTIDDRALTFTGEWPSAESLRAFKPWNKLCSPTPSQGSAK